MVLDSPVTTKSAQETAQLGQNLAYTLKEGSTRRVVCLYGELGSGKTTFVQGFAKGLGITSRLLSPTFIIVRRYKIPKSPVFLYHLDLYRVEENDLEELAISDIFSDPRSFVVIEWAEKLASWLPEKRLDIRFSVLPDGRHTISVAKLT